MKFNPFKKFERGYDPEQEKIEIEKTKKEILEDLEILSQKEFPSEIIDFINSIDYRQAADQEQIILLQKIFKKEKITAKDLPNTDLAIKALALRKEWLKQLKYGTLVLGEGYGYSAEMENNLNFIQYLIKNKNWKGYYNELGHADGGALSDIWAENENELVVVNRKNMHQLIPESFDFSLLKKSNRKDF
jgi:hypothetical protein